MGRRADRPEALRGSCFRGSDAVRRGLLTRDQLRGSTWRKLLHDVYADAELPDSHRLRCRAAALVLPPGAAVTGRSAVCLDALPLGAPSVPVRVVLPASLQFQWNGCRITRTAWLPAGHVLPGVPCVTVPQRTAWETLPSPT